MGPCKTSNPSIFNFINTSDLKFCKSFYSSCMYCTMRFKGLNGKVCKMMMWHFRILFKNTKVSQGCWLLFYDDQTIWAQGHYEKAIILMTNYLDCQGVITPSSGPPTKISFLILRKFSLWTLEAGGV